jgi:dihydrofolate reductase
MKVALIVAMDAERGIGKNNDLMWHLPADMRFFKETTLQQIVVMGRKNYDSIPEKYRPLANRLNVILTRNKIFEAENCLILHSLETCLNAFQNEIERTVFIIGGGEIYKMAMELNCLDEMYITIVDGIFGADTFFPEFDETNWDKNTIGNQFPDEKHSNGFEIVKYVKKK